MATKNRTSSPRRRASQRISLEINLADASLKSLMVEQCKSNGCFITVYRGSRAALVKAGVPEAAFPDGTDEVKEFKFHSLNVCCTGSKEGMQGATRSMPNGNFELEVDWGYVRPFVQGSHTAVFELARMLLIDTMAWTDVPFGEAEGAKLSRPFEMLALDPRSEYKPGPSDPRLQVSPEFYDKLRGAAMQLYNLVHNECEMLQVEAPEAAKATKKPALRLVTGSSPT